MEEGSLECFKTVDGKKNHLVNYSPGSAFGELALLYNSPRAASIVTLKPSTLFKLDRETFNHIVKDAVIN